MDPFQYLPYDKMIEICESLNNRDLSRLIRTSQKAYKTCQIIMNKREEQHEKDLEIKAIELANLIVIKQYLVVFLKNTATVSFALFISEEKPKIVIIQKSIWNIPSILPNKQSSRYREWEIDIDDIDTLKDVIHNLEVQGYVMI